MAPFLAHPVDAVVRCSANTTRRNLLIKLLSLSHGTTTAQVVSVIDTGNVMLRFSLYATIIRSLSLSPYSHTYCHTYYYWYSITHSLFHSRLKSFLFCKSSLPQPFLFLLQDSLYGFPRLFTVTSEHIRLFTF